MTETKSPPDWQQGLEVVLRLLARREHSAQELARKLKQRQFSAALIKDLLTHAQAQGWQSDARFLEIFVRQRVQSGDGPMKLLAALQQRGIDESAAQQAVAELSVDWSEICFERLQRKFGETPPQDAKQKAKMMRYLQQRGFRFDDIKKALNRQQQTYTD